MKKQVSLLYFALIQILFGYEWFFGGWEKIMGKKFVEELPGTLGFFASKNPCGWIKSFLEGFAINNASLIGYSVMWGELLIGIILVAAGLYFIFSKKDVWLRIFVRLSVIACVGGALMNGVFYLAAGWSSPSTSGINVIMFWTQIIFIALLYKLSARKK
ncbi:hypothetical protein KKC32_00650 [Patescibacteria group bacterium]|nr:hypothetical protein [Patescibacteria group bacterium]